MTFIEKRRSTIINIVGKYCVEIGCVDRDQIP